MRRIRFTPFAAQELDSIFDYIAAHNPSGARNVQRRIQALIDHLAEWPEAGAASRNRPGMSRFFAIPYLTRSTIDSTMTRSLYMTCAIQRADRSHDRRLERFRLGGITQAIGNRSSLKELEHFLDHKSLQLLWKMLYARVSTM